MTCAAVTMVFNEPEYLPIWCRYYGTELGPENCFIIDHGSDDGSTRGLHGFNIVRIPRSPKDNDKRTRFVSRFCSNLLEWYSAVVHTDVDEILVAEPGLYRGLADYAERCDKPVVNALGFDIHHVPAQEIAYNPHLPVLQQRKWARFSSSMCKPVMTRRPIEWSPGFHSADSEVCFHNAYLFHLRYFDLDVGLARLHRTRAMPWASERAGSHQRVPDTEFQDLMTRVARLPRLEDVNLLPEEAPLEGYLSKVLQSEKDFRKNRYNIDLHIFGDELMRVPARFSRSF